MLQNFSNNNFCYGTAGGWYYFLFNGWNAPIRRESFENLSTFFRNNRNSRKKCFDGQRKGDTLQVGTRIG